MKSDEGGKAKLIQFIRDVVKADLDEIRQEQHGFKETVKSLVAEQLNLMSIIIRHHDCITQLQKGHNHLKKRLKALQSSKAESDAETEERGSTAYREGCEKLKLILNSNEGGDQTDINFDESFDEILNAVEAIVEKHRTGLESLHKNQCDGGNLQPVPSSMQVWTQQNYREKVNFKSQEDSAPHHIRPTTTILKNATTTEAVAHQAEQTSSRRMVAPKLSILKKESLLKSPASSRTGQGLNSNTSSQQLVPIGVRPGTYSRKNKTKVKQQQERLPKVERIRTAVPPLPAFNFDRINGLQSMGTTGSATTRREPHHMPVVVPQQKIKSRFPPINGVQLMNKPSSSQRSSAAKVIGPKMSTKDSSISGHWSSGRAGRQQDLYPVLRKPTMRKLPSPRTRIREHFFNLKKKK